MPSRSLRFLLAVSALSTAFASGAFADWPPFGQAIITDGGAQVHSSIASDGADGAIVVWQNQPIDALNIIAQHVRADGSVDPAWPRNGRGLLGDVGAIEKQAGGQVQPVVVSDGAHGAIVVWEDLRDTVSDFDLYAQHVRADGTLDPAWPVNGVALTLAPGNQENPILVPDGAGGAIVAWTDQRSGAGALDVFAQHVLATGLVDPAWPSNGLAVSAGTAREEFPSIVSDGAGGAIVAWDDNRAGAVGFDVFAARVLASGVLDRAWPAGGRALCTITGDQGRPTIASDGAHGAVVAWTDGRVSGTDHIFAEHVLATGSLDALWPLNGRQISNAGVLESRPLAVSDGAGGAIVNWMAFAVHLNMFVQHIKANGALDNNWPAAGRALSNVPRLESGAEIVPDAAGGAVIAWADSGDIVAQHVLASGALDPSYPDSFRAVCNLPSEQGDLALVATSGGGAIASWTDGRNQNLDIFAMQVLLAGTVDVTPVTPPAIAFAPAAPNPARAGTGLTLRFTLSQPARTNLALYDATGRRVRRLLASDARPEGPQAITWDGRDDSGNQVRAGIYFARLEAEGRVAAVKFSTLP
jgi:FlgD Ig-like domain